VSLEKKAKLIRKRPSLVMALLVSNIRNDLWQDRSTDGERAVAVLPTEPDVFVGSIHPSRRVRFHYPDRVGQRNAWGQLHHEVNVVSYAPDSNRHTIQILDQAADVGMESISHLTTNERNPILGGKYDMENKARKSVWHLDLRSGVLPPLRGWVFVCSANPGLTPRALVLSPLRGFCSRFGKRRAVRIVAIGNRARAPEGRPM
jgi:hypothetical protein